MGGFVDKVKDSVFGSKLGKIDPVLGLQAGYFKGFKGMFDDISGETQGDAAADAAALQYQATMAGIEESRRSEEQQRADLAPFRNLGTPDLLSQYSQIAMQPTDYSYNPAGDTLLQDAANVASRNVMNVQAAQGKAGSGGTQLAINQALAPIYMQRENQIFNQRFNTQNQRFNQFSSLVGTAQNAAAGQGAATQAATGNISDLYGQGANALAAGQIAGANAQAQGTQNTVAALGALASLFSFSDERMKDDMELVGQDENGMNVYRFRYKSPIFEGYSAQEVAKVDPQNVMLDQSGMLKVSPKYAPRRVG